MPGDHVILRTPTDLEDAKRQLHLAVVFLCGHEYLANGTITLKGGDAKSTKEIETNHSNNGVGDKMSTPALTELQMLEIRLKRQEYTGQDTTKTIEKIIDETIKQSLRKIPVGSVTGMYCSECQGELRQNGACMICVNCGTTTGCS